MSKTGESICVHGVANKLTCFVCAGLGDSILFRSGVLVGDVIDDFKMIEEPLITWQKSRILQLESCLAVAEEALKHITTNAIHSSGCMKMTGFPFSETVTYGCNCGTNATFEVNRSYEALAKIAGMKK